jgi:hypothetical protein
VTAPPPLTPEQIAELRQLWIGVNACCGEFAQSDYMTECNTCRYSEAVHVMRSLCDSHEALRAQVQQLQAHIEFAPITANLSSASCRGCGSPNSPTLIDGRYSEGYFLLDERGINYPWHRECAAKALAQVQSLTEHFTQLGELLKTGGMDDPAFLVGAVRAEIEHRQSLTEQVERLTTELSIRDAKYDPPA